MPVSLSLSRGGRLLFIGMIILMMGGCVSGTTDPAKESLAQAQIPEVPQSSIDFQIIDLTKEQPNVSLPKNIIIHDFLSVLNPNTTSVAVKRHKLVVEIIEARTFFDAPKWHCRIVTRVQIISPDGTLLGVIEPAAHAFRFNMWGYGSAEEAQQEARRAIATEFSRLARPYLLGDLK